MVIFPPIRFPGKMIYPGTVEKRDKMRACFGLLIWEIIGAALFT